MQFQCLKGLYEDQREEKRTFSSCNIRIDVLPVVGVEVLVPYFLHLFQPYYPSLQAFELIYFELRFETPNDLFYFPILLFLWLAIVVNLKS